MSVRFLFLLLSDQRELKIIRSLYLFFALTKELDTEPNVSSNRVRSRDIIFCRVYLEPGSFSIQPDVSRLAAFSQEARSWIFPYTRGDGRTSAQNHYPETVGARRLCILPGEIQIRRH